MSQYDVHRGENPRIIFFIWIVIVASITLFLGLGWRQLIANHKYEVIEKRQTERRILKPGPRGDIYDRKGNLLVGNRPHYSAVVYLDDLRREFRLEYSKIIRSERERLKKAYDLHLKGQRNGATLKTPNYNELQWVARKNVIETYISKINFITGRDDSITTRAIIRHFNEQLLLPLVLVEDLTADQYARLIEQVPVQSPIKIHTDTARYYPYGEVAAHTLGYVQKVNPDSGEIIDDGLKTFTFKTKQGKTGIERYFDQLLSGTTGHEIWRVDPLGFQNALLYQEAPKQGEDFISSIDVHLQIAAENALGNRTGTAVALDVKTGEVLAIASQPSYDLNELSPYIPRKVFDKINNQGAWLNRSLQLSYPPGSTFKLLSAIAGLREGTIDTKTKHNCQGVFPLGNRIFSCHARNGHGFVDLAAAIEGSCNIFFYTEGLRIGIDKLSAEAQRFGLNERTGIEVPYETGRLVVPSKSWKQERIGEVWMAGDTANTAIGQGFLLVTPLQMATFIASVARGETRTKPTLRALSSKEGNRVDHGGEPIGLTSEQHNELWEGMERVVGNKGTGRLVQIEGLRIAGKTGTADFRAHGKEVNLAWFLGLAPVEDPQIAIAVMVEGTSSSDSYQGGSTAGPVAKDIFLEFIEHYPERAGLASSY
ncbi:MAG: penicillin-binding transpeptidase domain-containing protein [Verrucomicrobiota bacterium]|nr:penicillin-binding transpeptidase domain-containing protein [Verrucomicrobiota bacterium]